MIDGGINANVLCSLDVNGHHAENVQKDLLNYINFRVNNSPSIQSNLVTGAAGQYRFCQHLLGLCRGSFLFAKLTLDLFERGHLVAKSTSFKVLPVTLAQIYQLHFNLRFPTASAFQRVSSRESESRMKRMEYCNFGIFIGFRHPERGVGGLISVNY